jgi:hypothetical protein
MNQKIYYSPARERFFNLKHIKRICKKFNLSYELDEELQTVWFNQKED